MQCIIIDLEANYKNDFSEIISIGAYRTHIEYVVKPLKNPTKNQQYYIEAILKPTNDSFYTLVKPVFTGKTTKKLKKLLNISDEELSKANTFDVCIEKFKEWVNENDEETVYGAWSKNDFFFIKRNCQKHFIPHKWFTNHYFDLQKAYDLQHKKKNSTSLQIALNELNIEFDGQQHNALDDSYNTMRIVSKTL